MTDKGGGDNITVGNVTDAQGVAIGREASATVIGSQLSSGVKVDAGQLRNVLSELYTSLAQAGMPIDKTISMQTSVGKAIEAANDDNVQVDSVVANVQKVGDVLKGANAAVEQGSSLWQSIQKLAPLLGPLVGGARFVGQWFGVPIP